MQHPRIRARRNGLCDRFQLLKLSEFQRRFVGMPRVKKVCREAERMREGIQWNFHHRLQIF